MRVRLKHIKSVRKRLSDGTEKTFYYHRKTGKRIEGEPHTKEFRQSYDKAATPDAPPSPELVSDLIRLYKDSEEFQALSTSAKKDYLSQLNRIEAKFGTMQKAALEQKRVRKHFKAWRNEVAKQSKRQADYGISVLSRMLGVAYDEGEISINHALRISRVYESNRAAIIWEPQEVEAFCGKGCSQVLIFGCQFARLGGLRRTDLVAIPLSADKGTYLNWFTSKSGKRFEIVIPIYAEMRTLLDAMKAYRRKKNVQASTILFNSRGRPWTESGFSASFRKRQAKAGLADLHLHDLRGTAATEFMKHGLSDNEIADILGWSAKDVAAIRKKYVDRVQIVSAIVKRLERNAG